MKKLHAPTLRPDKPGEFAICDQRLFGPFAADAAGVTCRRCLAWPEIVRRGFNATSGLNAPPKPRPKLELVPTERLELAPEHRRDEVRERARALRHADGSPRVHAARRRRDDDPRLGLRRDLPGAKSPAAAS
jgi:hypothetical protein